MEIGPPTLEARLLASQTFNDEGHSWLSETNGNDDEEEEEDDPADRTEEDRASLELAALGQAYAGSTIPLSKLSR